MLNELGDGASDLIVFGRARGAARPGRHVRPQIVPKHALRVEGFDETIISLYAKGFVHRGERRASGRDL